MACPQVDGYRGDGNRPTIGQESASDRQTMVDRAILPANDSICHYPTAVSLVESTHLSALEHAVGIGSISIESAGR